MKAGEQVRLGDLATVITGLVVSRKKSLDDQGYKYKMLSLRSFNDNGYIDKEYLDDFISTEEIPKHQLTQVGDVVIRLSYPNTAVYISEEQEGYIITSLFAVIRLESERAISKFIQVYLNSEKAKRQLAGDTIGSAVAVIKTSSFKELKVPLYAIEYQEKIISMHEAIMKEKYLLSQLVQEKEKFYKVITNKMLR